MRPIRLKRRTLQAQIAAMAREWPQFNCQPLGPNEALWRGPVRPRGQSYDVGVIWAPAKFDRPYVSILSPKIEPREGGSFEEIPHLIFDRSNPANSGLCLFDPDGKEWCEGDLIAKTTMLWTVKWLLFYELWHLTGEWHGGGVGAESVAAMERELTTN